MSEAKEAVSELAFEDHREDEPLLVYRMISYRPGISHEEDDEPAEMRFVRWFATHEAALARERYITDRGGRVASITRYRLDGVMQPDGEF